jgi:hypothetical protein
VDGCENVESRREDIEKEYFTKGGISTSRTEIIAGKEHKLKVTDLKAPV